MARHRYNPPPVVPLWAWAVVALSVAAFLLLMFGP